MKAMILSAGYGTRLGDLTRDLPKPMLDLHGRPLLEYIIRHLRRHGFDQIALNLHFKPELIQNYFGQGDRWGVELVYSYEAELLGTAGGVKKMEPFLGIGDDFLIHYGDILTDQNFTAMLHFHRQHNALVTLLLHQRAVSNSVVSLDDTGRIVGFLERPSAEARRGITSTWVNSGVYLCAPGFLAEIPGGQVCDLPRDVFPGLVAGGRLYGFALSGYRCAIDSPERLTEARAAIIEQRCQVD